MSCDACKYLPNPAYLVIRTDYWQVVLSPDQAYLGRSYVTLRTHKESLSDLSREEWQDFEVLVRRLELSYEKVLGSGRPFNWACMMNNEFKADAPSPHVHWHLRPRHNRPVTINGETFTDSEYAHHYDKNRHQEPEPATLRAIAEKLRLSVEVSS